MHTFLFVLLVAQLIMVFSFGNIIPENRNASFVYSFPRGPSQFSLVFCMCLECCRSSWFYLSSDKAPASLCQLLVDRKVLCMHAWVYTCEHAHSWV